MCGLTGVFTARHVSPPTIEMLRDMVAMLGHRGPDGYGLFRDERVGLGHARLSIIDLAGGFQPLANEDESIWLTFNGEIFNYVELRRELRAAGHRFRTHTDSEVVVHLYEEYGDDAWARLNGQFAFALWDRRQQQLRLVRDRLGILPLYYARANSSVLFASEAKALFASGALDPVFDPISLTETFTRWSVAAPRSIFEGVQSVRPGTALVFDTGLHEREHRYWQLDFTEDPELAALTVDAAADQLGELLTDAVRLRLRADVPVGAYLSGGLDSSVIGSLVRSVESSPLETFAVRFADPSFDETAEQRRMAELLGTRHHEVLCDDEHLRDCLDTVVWHCETPLLRTAPAPLFLLSALVRERGMKVVLTGEGADELFAGYGIFKEDKIRRFWASDSDSDIRPQLFARIHSEIRGAARETDWWSRFFGKNLTDTGDPCYSHRIRWDNTAWGLRLLTPDARATTIAGQPSFGPELPAGFARWSPLSRAQWLEVQTFLSPYLLPYQGDRVAMAHGVEARYPFLDPAIVDFATRLPTRLKMPVLRDKLVLRRLAGRTLPPDVAERPKIPYRAPMTRPFFGPHADGFGEGLLSQRECRRFGLLDGDMVARLTSKARRLEGTMNSEREEMALTGALTLQMLAGAFLDDRTARQRRARAALDGAELRVLADQLVEAPS